MTQLTFLGTGGGRFTTIRQARNTGGLYLQDKGFRANIDPGPGALVHMHRYGLDPLKTDAILCSHAHPDHWTDLTVLLEGMTRGGIDRKGTLAAPRSVLRGTLDVDDLPLGPVVSPRHQGQVERLVEVSAGSEIDFGPHKVTATKQDHSDPDTVGFRADLTHGSISYIPDTQYFDGLSEPHKGARVLVCQMTRGGSDRIPWHMCTDDVAMLVDEIQPKLCLLTHFGFKTLRDGDPSRWAKQITAETGVMTIAGQDGLQLTLGEKMEMQLLGVQPPLTA